MMTLHWANRPALLALLLLAVLTVMMLIWKRRRPLAHRRLHPALTVITLLLCILGAARPQIGTMVSERIAHRGSVVFMLDISQSMLAEDIKPSRLEFAKIFTRQVLDRLQGARIAIFPFSEFGYFQMPFTDDLFAARDFLQPIDAATITNQGTDLGASLRSLIRGLDDLEQRSRTKGQKWTPPSVVILSDGESSAKFDHAIASELRRNALAIFSIGIGTSVGATIPVDTPFGAGQRVLKDDSDKTVITKLEPDSLQQLAEQTGGQYYPASIESIGPLTERLTRQSTYSMTKSRFRAQAELFPVLLLLAVVFCLADLIAQGWKIALKAALVICIVPICLSAERLSLENEKLLDESGAKRPTTAYNLGVAEYKKGDLAQAYELFLEATREQKNKVLKKKANFDLGNTLMLLGDPARALHAYQSAIDIRAGRFDREADTRISENMVLAMRTYQQMQREQRQGNDGEGDNRSSAKDSGGPNSKYSPEQFTAEQKERIFKLIQSEEQQTIQRVQGKRQHSPAGVKW